MHPVNRLLSVSIMLAAVCFAHTARAELKGSYQLNGGKQTLDLYYANDRRMRADLDHQNQLVMKDAAIWLLQRQGEQWLAVDSDRVSGLLKAVQAKHPTPKLGPIALRATERREVVAGYPGRVYQATRGDQTSEVVLSDNPEVLALTNGWRKLTLKLAESLGAAQAEQLQQVLDTLPAQGMGGLLREGDHLLLVAVDAKASAGGADFPAQTKMLELPKFQLPNFN
jgi:hypothetical protein